MQRRRVLAFDFLERIESLSKFTSVNPHWHAREHVPKRPVHVRPHADKAPHSNFRAGVTGLKVAGQIYLSSGPLADSPVVSVFGAGTITIGSIKYPATGFAIQYDPSTQLGTLSLVNDNGTITAKVTMLADGSAGNYEITDATGDFTGAQGTGLFYVHATTIAINPHSQQV